VKETEREKEEVQGDLRHGEEGLVVDRETFVGSTHGAKGEGEEDEDNTRGREIEQGLAD